MPSPSAALQFLLLTFAGWVSRQQQDVIAYLQEENRILREQLGGRRLRLTDAQRRRLAAKGKALGRKALREVAGVVTPDTILRWYRQLIARKYDGGPRSRTALSGSQGTGSEPPRDAGIGARNVWTRLCNQPRPRAKSCRSSNGTLRRGAPSLALRSGTTRTSSYPRSSASRWMSWWRQVC